MVRNTLKDFLQLPTDFPDSMIYSERKNKGLGLFRIQWEAYLQRINGCKNLLMSDNIHVITTYDLAGEIDTCYKKLDIDRNDDPLNVRRIRKCLRQREFDHWCSLPQKGKGVILYKQFTPANTWIYQPEGLSSSEWKEALKMTSNVCPVRAVPGRSQDNHCRRCGSEIETLAHVLGVCPFGATLRNTRHHKVRSMIAEALRENKYQVYEEVHGVSENGSHRRIDMIAIPSGSSSAIIIDPTIRWEIDEDQPAEVHKEKCNIYEPTVPYYCQKYHLENIRVIGLMIGARGTIPTHFVSFCRSMKLDNTFIKSIALSALKGSLQILRNHLYGT